MGFEHEPVLLDECLRELKVKPDGTYADGTLGGAGHSLAICERLGKKGRLFGFDQDGDAIAVASQRLGEYGDRVTVVHSNFRFMADELKKRDVSRVDGILLDLGVSSYQLDTAERGFSYRQDAPLDMRMDQSQRRSAADVVNTCTEDELFHIIRDFGEERFARNIARNICREREKKAIASTGELAEIVKRSIPAKRRGEKGHPAKRTFQAIRIEVNAELSVLGESLGGMIDLLSDKGRLCVITFHSLEDRIVKNIFRENEIPCICPPEFPVCVCGRKPKGVCVPKRPIVPTEEEIRKNIRSHSAKLRVFERRYQK